MKTDLDHKQSQTLKDFGVQLMPCLIVFSAIHVQQNDRPYSDHFGLLELQQLNGMKIGIRLYSGYSATEIIDHTSKEMRNRIIQVLDVSGRLSVIISESTSLGTKSTLIVYLKCEVSKELPPISCFWT